MPSNALTNGFGSQSGATSYRSPADGGHVEMSYCKILIGLPFKEINCNIKQWTHHKHPNMF